MHPLFVYISSYYLDARRFDYFYSYQTKINRDVVFSKSLEKNHIILFQILMENIQIMDYLIKIDSNTLRDNKEVKIMI